MKFDAQPRDCRLRFKENALRRGGKNFSIQGCYTFLVDLFVHARLTYIALTTSFTALLATYAIQRGGLMLLRQYKSWEIKQQEQLQK